MPNYRRARVPGACYFFTVVTYRRSSVFESRDAQSLLGNVIRECRERWPFVVNAMVLLPDHLHAMWTLPRGDDRYSARWGYIKKQFTSRYLAETGVEQGVSAAEQKERRRGVWQPRFWEHTIQSESDFERHFDYLHYNPVKHQYVQCPHEWSASSFHRWVNAGVYSRDWGCQQSLRFPDVQNTTGDI
ncbi:transposase [bacterium]|nr:transposase [bacterium]